MWSLSILWVSILVDFCWSPDFVGDHFFGYAHILISILDLQIVDPGIILWIGIFWISISWTPIPRLGNLHFFDPLKSRDLQIDPKSRSKMWVSKNDPQNRETNKNEPQNEGPKIDPKSWNLVPEVLDPPRIEPIMWYFGFNWRPPNTNKLNYFLDRFLDPSRILFFCGGIKTFFCGGIPLLSILLEIQLYFEIDS